MIKFFPVTKIQREKRLLFDRINISCDNYFCQSKITLQKLLNHTIIRLFLFYLDKIENSKMILKMGMIRNKKKYKQKFNTKTNFNSQNSSTIDLITIITIL